MDHKAEIRIKEREAAVKAWLKELEEVKGAKFPVLPERIYEALENIDVAKALKEFTPDIMELQKDINENELEALVYEWFYDGGEVNNILAFTYTYKECVFDGEPGNTDLLELPDQEGFEMEPELKNTICDEGDAFCLDPVMNVLYEELLTEFNSKFDEYYDLNDELEVDVDLDTVSDAYQELFHLKLMSLIREAYFSALEENPIQITTGKPFHVFIKRHERWPMHVLSLNI